MDVCFDGSPKAGTDETDALPPHAVYPNKYCLTKRLAEDMVRDSNSSSFRTCVLRPAHIYGPGDDMITTIVEMRARYNTVNTTLCSAPPVPCVQLRLSCSWQIPFRFGTGLNFYTYVDNCAHAHALALEYLEQCTQQGDKCENKSLTQSPGLGAVFFIGEHVANVWDHMHPFLTACGQTSPAARVPVLLLVLFAWAVEVLCWVAQLCSVHLKPTFTLYTVRAVAQDFYFSCEEAKRVLGFSPIVTRSQAEAGTVAWLQRKYPR